jgi:hypothetical protein
MDSKRAYRLKAEILKRKYGVIAEEFKQYKDDRLLVANMLDQLLEVCEDMETVLNAFISVAVNKSIKEQDAEMEAIVTRFTGTAYKDNRWQSVTVYNVYKFQQDENFEDCRDVLVKSTPDGELAFHFAKQLDEMGHAVHITVTRPDGSEDRIWN